MPRKRHAVPFQGSKRTETAKGSKRVAAQRRRAAAKKSSRENANRTR
jgi:hypothetical protein